MKFGTGQSILRTEDPRLLTGKGRFTDDMTLPGMVYGVSVRSPYGHADILNIDTAAARAKAGVLAVYTAADLTAYAPLPCLVNFNPAAPTPQPLLAGSRVRYVGEAVAFVVADTRAAAKAAAEAVVVDYADLPAVATIDEAIAPGAPTVWDHSPNNQPWVWQAGDAAACDIAFASAKHVTKLRLVQNRVAPTSMEVRAALAAFDAETGFTLCAGSQGVAGMREVLANMGLNEPAERIRVITGDVGGGFGMKSFLYPEYMLTLHAARALGRPVKWTGERTDAFLTDTHGRDLVTDVELALSAEGKMLALRAKSWSNLGAYHGYVGAFIQTLAGGKMLGGVYDIPAIHNQVTGVLSNTVPVDAYRGAGRPEATYITERVVDAAAHELGIAPDDLRRRNLLKPAQLPHVSPLDVTFDIGNFPAVLERALQKADWNGFYSRHTPGKRRGRGICFYVEITAFNGTNEWADAHFTPDGLLEIAVGTQSNGQGHETAYAQVAAAQLGIAIDRVRIVQGDTARLELGNGTGGSRSLHFGAAAVVVTMDEIIATAMPLAKAALNSDAVAYDSGVFRADGSNRNIDIFTLAQQYPGKLDVRGMYKVEKPTPTFPNGCHIAEVEIDEDTGDVQVVRYNIVDDFGTILNPMLVQGQIHGGVAQGLGQALMENIVYGDGAQMMTASFMDYAIPKADHMPHMSFESLGVPNPNNPLGVKGCGEAGTIGAMPAIMNAISHALGGAAIDMPATPEKIWRILQSQRKAA
jgi:aerobic carbon-monoxide dehydrogenase large subunit